MLYFYAQRLDGDEPSHPIMAYNRDNAREIAETVLELSMRSPKDEGGYYIVKAERADWLSWEIEKAASTWAAYQAINQVNKES